MVRGIPRRGTWVLQGTLAGYPSDQLPATFIGDSSTDPIVFAP
jgi:hypothetical protein